MTSQRFSSSALVLIAITASATAFAANDACPSTEDIAYSIHEGDTWESLAARAYCRNGPHDRTQAALALHEYNRGRVGPSISAPLRDGTKVCLPKHIHGRYFDAEVCEAAPKSSSGPNDSKGPDCGNGIREGDETCDGNDLAGMTCTGLRLPPGNVVCRSDCRGFDASVCISKPPPPPPQQLPPPPLLLPPPMERPIPLSLDADAAGGLMFPLSTPGTAAAYGTIVMARVGARFDAGPFRFLGHGIVGTGGGTTRLDGHAADLDVQLAGIGLQVGLARTVRLLTVTPGVEAQRLFLVHRMDARPPFGPDYRETSGAITILGAFVRGEYRFRRLSRLAAALEVALGYVPGEIAGLPVSTRFQMKTLAGVTYHAF